LLGFAGLVDGLPLGDLGEGTLGAVHGVGGFVRRRHTDGVFIDLCRLVGDLLTQIVEASLDDRFDLFALRCLLGVGELCAGGVTFGGDVDEFVLGGDLAVRVL